MPLSLPPAEIVINDYMDKGASRTTGDRRFIDVVNAEVVGKIVTKVILCDSNVNETNMKVLE